MKLVLFILSILLAPRCLADIDCTRPGRLSAAESHYKSGCYLTAIRICSGLYPIGPNNRYDCYQSNLTLCELEGAAYKKWLSGRKLLTH